jgi:photosystem II stability/assembly factor-like uncharacterized protein
MKKKLYLYAILLFALLIGGYFYFPFNQPATREPKALALTPEEMHDAYITFKRERRKNGYAKFDGPNEFALYEMAIRTRDGMETPEYEHNYQLEELKKALHKRGFSQSRTREEKLPWVERGPANVPGRTRGLIILPDDPQQKTWLAGSVGGGIWKTYDEGKSWHNKTPDLPNLATSTLAVAAFYPKIIYAGTGEGFYNIGSINGNGIFKSIDGGESWFQLSSTANNLDFQNINRIVVHPFNENILLACSNTGLNFNFRSAILRSENGGNTWTKVYEAASRIQQIIADPHNFDIQYATVNGYGVIKSIDQGRTWFDANHGMAPEKRVEVAISPTNPNRLYAGAEGFLSGSGSDLYISDDGGASWSLVMEERKEFEFFSHNVNWMGGQGWFNNSLAAHPFNEDVVYVGGIDLWKMKMRPGKEEGPPQLLGAREINTTSFLDFTNWGGQFLRGGLGTGEKWFENDFDLPFDVLPFDYSSVEIRFGTNRKQKAHRFTVPSGSSSGVEAKNYTYRDYVDVPFEVWDIDNNRQLMISFRDQENDGKFDLEASNPNKAREYLFIHGIPYNPNAPNSQIAKQAGHGHKTIYVLWPKLAAKAQWQPNQLPESKIHITYGPMMYRFRQTQNLTDAYSNIDGRNSIVHPDHHNIATIIKDYDAQTFKIVSANDGGIYYSNTATDPGVNFGDWTFAGQGYNTGQFYGVDKCAGKDEYIGGLQDNGTWRSQSGKPVNAESNYLFQLPGDGFETVWNNFNTNLIIASSQYNGFQRTTDRGKTWRMATSGLSDNSQGSAPFISKLASSKKRPDVLFTVGKTGIWRSDDFGQNWKSIPITQFWTFGNFTDIKVSIANPNVVWAGGAMGNAHRLHVSVDGGRNFRPTNNYGENITLGRISGIATHPIESATAYALFSFGKGPKILRTTDLGETWQEISGFLGKAESQNGFPDVAVYCLLVMPYNTNILWAGTEIGIVESTDGGKSWSLANNGLPSVSIWDMKVVDDQIVVATHGRGIWTLTDPRLQTKPRFQENEIAFSISPNPVKDMARIEFNLPEPSVVRVIISSLNGQIVEDRNLGERPAGVGVVEWSRTGLKKGIYIAKLYTRFGQPHFKILVE